MWSIVCSLFLCFHRHSLGLGEQTSLFESKIGFHNLLLKPYHKSRKFENCSGTYNPTVT